MKNFLIATTLIANSGCGFLMTVEQHDMIISNRNKIIKRNIQEINSKKREIEKLEEKKANCKYDNVVLNQSVERKEKTSKRLKQQLNNMHAKYAELNRQFYEVLAEKNKLESYRVKKIEISQDSKEFLDLYLLALEEGYDGFFRQYAENFSESGHSSKSVEKEVRKVYEKTLKLGKKTIFEKNADFKIEYTNNKVQGKVSFDVGKHVYEHDFIVEKDLNKLKNSGINYAVGFKVSKSTCYRTEFVEIYDRYGLPIVDHVTLEIKTKKVKKKYKCLKVNTHYLIYTYNGEVARYET